MSKKTVAQLDAEVQYMKSQMSNIQLSQVSCWNWEQVAVELEKHSRHGELIKMEITLEHFPDKNKYILDIWHYPLLNRGKESGDYYEALRRTKEHI